MRRLIIVLFAVLVPIALLFWWNTASQPPAKDTTPRPFVIARGMSAGQVAEKLEKEGFIRSSLAFRFYVQVTGNADKIQAGDYRLSKNLPLSALVRELLSGPVALWVTFPEGMRREEIAEKISETFGLVGASRQAFLKDFLDLTAKSEGYLFPDTYLFFKNVTPSAVVDKLKATFEKKMDSKIFAQASRQDLTLEELIILASIVVRETKTEGERPVVAGILLKRLRAGWPLQVDATLQYAVGNVKCRAAGIASGDARQISNVKCEWWEPVKSADKKISSLYNTYIHRGLPPAPIANPGLSSIQAIANPQTSPYWFYLHDSEGKVHYAVTAKEHEENVRKYLQ